MHCFLETMITGMIPKPSLVMWMLMSMMIIVTAVLLLIVMFLMMMIYIYITNQKNTKTAFFNHFSFILTPKNIHIYVHTYVHTYFKCRAYTSYIVAPWIIVNPKSPFSFSFISSPLTIAEAFTGLSFSVCLKEPFAFVFEWNEYCVCVIRSVVMWTHITWVVRKGTGRKMLVCFLGKSLFHAHCSLLPL